MEMIVERPAALDVHKAQVTACARVPGAGGARVGHVVEFQTTVRGLLALRDWLAELGVTQVAMEATGVFWKPVWYVLEDDFECLLVNARHVKQVPGSHDRCLKRRVAVPVVGGRLVGGQRCAGDCPTFCV